MAFSDHDSINDKMELFLNNIHMPSINAEEKRKTEGEITENEINTAICQMAPGKSPGLDGLPQEFYSKFHSKLSSLLLAHYNGVFQKGAFSTSSNTASIILLPKKDKDPLLCGSQRPLSILNCDNYDFG